MLFRSKAHVTELTSRIKGIGKLITESDEDKARARDTQLLNDCGGEVKPTPRQDVQPALTSELLSPLEHPARGTIFPQPLLQGKDGHAIRMDEVFPAGWKVIFSKNAEPDCFSVAMHHHLPNLQVAQLGVGQLIELENVLDNWFSKHAVVAAIVRPDHYIYGVCNKLENLTQQLDELKLV